MTNKSLKKSLLVLLLAPGLIFPLAKISNTNNVSNNTNQAGVTAVPQQQVNKMVIMFKGKQVNDVIRLFIDGSGYIFLNTYNEGLLVSIDNGKTFQQIIDPSTTPMLIATDFVKKFAIDSNKNVVLVIGDNNVLTFSYSLKDGKFGIADGFMKVTYSLVAGVKAPTFINDIRFGRTYAKPSTSKDYVVIMSSTGLWGSNSGVRKPFVISTSTNNKSVISYSLADVVIDKADPVQYQAMITSDGQIFYDGGIGTFINITASFKNIGLTAFSDVTVTQLGELLIAGGSVNKTNALVETKVIVTGTGTSATAAVNIVKTTRMSESINLTMSSWLLNKQIVYVATDTGVYQTGTFIDKSNESLPPFKLIVANFPTDWISQSFKDNAKLVLTSETQGVYQTTVTDQIPTPTIPSANKAAGANIANIDIAILSLVVVMLAIIGSTIFYKVGKEKGLFNKKVVKVAKTNKPTKK